MIDYNLAKQLKDAGFPQHSLCNNECMTEGDVGIDMCIPTLSELIEACGEKFKTLERPEKLGEWIATKRNEFKDNKNVGAAFGMYGKSPEEAVANLLLALNKKKPA